MKRSLGRGLLCAALCLPLAACFTMTHTVGKGGSKPAASARQWYVLWGLVPLGHHDGGKMAGKATDYTVMTQQSFLDVVINIFTGMVTIGSRTITVMK